MFIVAGPPGGGKSTAFPVSGFGVDFFNADDRAAALNHGSYIDIPRSIREKVNLLFESFVLSHIERTASCVFETTLRSHITFDQVALAREFGFVTEMRYVALQDFAMHLERLKMRAEAGGHSAPERLLKAIYESSINNLPRAMGDGPCVCFRQQPMGHHSQRTVAGRRWGDLVPSREHPGLADGCAPATMNRKPCGYRPNE